MQWWINSKSFKPDLLIKYKILMALETFKLSNDNNLVKKIISNIYSLKDLFSMWFRMTSNTISRLKLYQNNRLFFIIKCSNNAWIQDRISLSSITSLKIQVKTLNKTWPNLFPWWWWSYLKRLEIAHIRNNGW